MSNVKDIKTIQDFEEMINQGGLYLIDFWAPWCGPCRFMGPIIDELSQDLSLKSIHFVKCNADELGELVEKFGIQSIPTFPLIKVEAGKTFNIETDVLETFVGSQSKEDFKTALQKFV